MIVNWFKALFAKTQEPASGQSPIARFTPLKLCVGSNITVQVDMIEAFDANVSAPIPYSLMNSLSVKSIYKQQLFNDSNATRYIVTFNEQSPDTNFDISLELLERNGSVVSSAFYIGVEELYPSTPADWKQHLHDMTLDQRDIQGTLYSQQYYCDTVSNTALTQHPAVSIDHEAVFTRVVDDINIEENFRIRVLNGTMLEYSIGYNINPTSIVVNF